MTVIEYTEGLIFWIIFYSLLGAIVRDVAVHASMRRYWERRR